MSTWRVELLSKRHDRGDFDCEQEGLNRFLLEHAGQDARKDISRTYVVVFGESSAVMAYYTLSSGSLAFEAMPEDMAGRLPRYPIPTAHIGRLAVDARHQGQHLGPIVLADALKRIASLAERIGIHAVTVHALNDRARAFYLTFGFIPLQDDPYHFFFPMATIRKL